MGARAMHLDLRWVLLSVVAQMVCTQATVAQAVRTHAESLEVRLRKDEALAYLYAPVLHFAPQERYFPILPFFNAFLRVQDSTTPWLTPSLAGELIPVGKGGDSLILWNSLAREYDSLQMTVREVRESTTVKSLSDLGSADSLDAALARLSDTDPAREVVAQVRDTFLAEHRDTFPADQREAAQKLFQAEWAPQVAALFYRVWYLSPGESRAVWRRLRTDFQVWDRLLLPDSVRAHEANDGSLPRLISLEYYAYYIRDLGLTGHAQDLEKFFVFIPADSTSVPVEIMVGAAHSVVTPNNVVLVARKRNQGNLLYPPHALVEFGGHSFSPDIPPNGLFTPGWDINWRASERSWGVRDIQAILGTGFGGDYRSQYTLPRTDSIGVTLSPLPAGARLRDSIYRPKAHSGFYALIPIQPYQNLFFVLDTAKGIQEVREAWDALTPILERKMWPVRKFPTDADSVIADSVYHRLRFWLKDLAQQADSIPGQLRKVTVLGGSGSKMKPWTANEFIQSPQHIMKAWLYRPQDPARACRGFDYFPVHGDDLPNFELGFRYGIGKQWSHTGLVLEWIDAYHCIERKSKLGIPGTLSLGFAFSPFAFNHGPQELQLRYQHRYFSPQSFTWSLALSVVARYDSTETAEVRGNRALERSRIRVRPALNLMPLGLLFGAKMEPNWINLVLSSIIVRVGPQIDLFHPSRSMAWQAEIAVRPFPKFRPRGHRSTKDGGNP